MVCHRNLYLGLCCLPLWFVFEDYSSDFTSFGDDATPYECGLTLNKVINNLEKIFEKGWMVRFQQLERKYF